MTDPIAAIRDWRPQQFGTRRAQEITDPLIEPLWTGPRVLVLIDGGTVRAIDGDGDEVDLPDELVTALAAGTAGRLVVEAVLTPQPLQRPEDVAARDKPKTPSPADAIGQMVIGSRSDRRARLAAEADEAERRALVPAEEFAAVVVDLLWLDDQPLLDVPLLERRRILEAELAESRLVRRGIHVRLPVDPWLGPWRSFGFSSIAYKAANSRYLPGRTNDDWSIARIPVR
jgi:hypothetical protein